MIHLFYAILFSQNIFAFTLVGTNSNLQGYNADKISFNLNTSVCPAGVDGDIKAAIDLWNSVATSGLVLEKSSETSTAVSGWRQFSQSERWLIGCSTDFANDSCNSSGSDCCSSASCLQGVLGVTRVTLDGDRLYKAILILNMNNNLYADQSNQKRKITVAHEIGHALGLGHSGERSALMYFDVSLKNNMALSQDDADGITYLYPRNELGEDKFYGCGLIKNSNPKPPWGFGILLLPILLITYLKFKIKYKGAYCV